MRQPLAASSERKMATMHVFLLEVVLISTMIGHSGARRPQIAAEELLKNPASMNLAADAADRAGDPRHEPALRVAVGASSCYFNRDCRVREFCVKPDDSAFTPGVCSLISGRTPARSSGHSSDLHFLVRAGRGSRVRRSVAAPPGDEATGKTTDLLLQLMQLGKGDRLARALANYVHAKYPISWEQDDVGKDEKGRPRKGGKSSAVDSRDADQPGQKMDPDLKAIIEKGRHREMQSAEDAPSLRFPGEVVDAHGTPTTSSQGPTEGPQHPVIEVKENDMASGPKRQSMKGANYVR